MFVEVSAGTSSHLAGLTTIVDLFEWIPCYEFVLIIHDHIANVISICICILLTFIDHISLGIS